MTVELIIHNNIFEPILMCCTGYNENHITGMSNVCCGSNGTQMFHPHIPHPLSPSTPVVDLWLPRDTFVVESNWYILYGFPCEMDFSHHKSPKSGNPSYIENHTKCILSHNLHLKGELTNKLNHCATLNIMKTMWDGFISTVHNRVCEEMYVLYLSLQCAKRWKISWTMYRMMTDYEMRGRKLRRIKINMLVYLPRAEGLWETIVSKILIYLLKIKLWRMYWSICVFFGQSSFYPLHCNEQ